MPHLVLICFLLCACGLPPAAQSSSTPSPADQQPAERPPEPRPRLRELGVVVGRLPVGPRNAITDVPGVRVGHCSLRQGRRVHTGVTVVLPHGENPFQHKVPAAVVVANGYGKLVGSTQVAELGELESPIALTNTLAVGRVMDALVGEMLAWPGNERVRSVNVVVGETNDGFLSDIRARPLQAQHLRQALAAARASAAGAAVAEGVVGAGCGTVCFGFKGGIGTASRQVQDYRVGVLVQSNFGGRLRVAGRELPPSPGSGDGSCMIVLATDAPLLAKGLERLARRALVGMARCGASFSNGSGDYVLAFSTAEGLRRRPGQRRVDAPVLTPAAMSPLFVAAAEACEEAILNSLCRAVGVRGHRGEVRAMPLGWLRR